MAQGFTGSSSAYALKGRRVNINGDMRVAQRGAGPFTSATAFVNNDGAYLLDGWCLLSDGNDIVDVSQSTSTVPDGAYASLAADVETANKKFGFVQFIEARDTKRLFKNATGTVSLSFKAKAAASISNIKAVVLAWTSTADSPTKDIVSTWNADDNTPTWVANYTAENTPANLGVGTGWTTCTIEGIALDTASTTNLAIFIWNDDLTTTVTDFLYISDVQLEPGSVATDFEYRSIQEEITACERYFEKTYNAATAPGTAATTGCTTWGVTDSTNYIVASFSFKTRKRTPPTITAYDMAGTSAKMSYFVVNTTQTNGKPVNVDFIGEHTFRVYTDNATSKCGFALNWTASAELGV